MHAIVAAAVLFTAVPADWELLGTRRVNLRIDHDAIVVGAREGTYTAIKIEVAGGTLDMYNIRVTFGNGETWSPNTRLTFREGSWSRTIDLPGPKRFIRRIDFWYRSRIRRGAATVRVFGRSAPAALEPSVAASTTAESTPQPQAPPPTAPPPSSSLLQNSQPPPPPEPPPTASEHLACRPVNFQTTRDSVIEVGPTPYRGIQFDVEGGDIELYDIKVTYADGETFTPGTRLTFGSARSRLVELPGEPRAVRRVEYSYRRAEGLLSSGEKRTTVHVYGRR